VAVGETETGHAHPLAAIAEEANAARFAAIEKRSSPNGSPPPGGRPADPPRRQRARHDRRCRRFANQLHGRYGLPVALVDERLSSAEAEERLRSRPPRLAQAKPRLDSAAAQIILLQYFESAKHAAS
jgi:putative Holliday junction resolvase